jgi:hypothetical protein
MRGLGAAAFWAIDGAPEKPAAAANKVANIHLLRVMGVPSLEESTENRFAFQACSVKRILGECGEPRGLKRGLMKL